MSELTYKQLLSGYSPKEEGDFFVQYKLDIGTFVIYAPKDGQISCIEMFSYNDLSPIDLSVLLDKPMILYSEEHEYSFEHSCKREDLLKYLFDVNKLDKDTGSIRHTVLPFDAYLLEDVSVSIRKQQKVINIFNYNSQDKIFLSFDNTITYRDNGNKNVDIIYITFDPRKYDSLVSDVEINNNFFIFLLATGNNLFFDKIFEYGKQMNVILGKENPIEVLKLYVYFLNLNNPASTTLDYSNYQILIGFKKEIYPVPDIMNIINESIDYVRQEISSEVRNFYNAKATKETLYISFRNSHILSYAFNYSLRNKFKEKFNKIATIL